MMDISQVQEMAQLINLACGTRSVAEFANSCGISRAHIFRIKNGVMPSRKLCKRIAEDRYVQQLGITCEHIYRLAGYTDSKDIIEAQQHDELVSKNATNDALDIGIITQNLMGSKFSISLLPVENDLDVDFSFLVQKGKKKIRWNFIIAVGEIQEAKSRRRVNAYYYNLGRVTDLTSLSAGNAQYTLLVHSMSEFEQLYKMADLLLIKNKVSIVFLDVEQRKIIREVSVGQDRALFSLSEEN